MIKIFKKLFIGIVLLLVIGGYFIAKDNNYNLKENSDDRNSFMKDLSGWVINLFGNTKDLVDEAKEKDWIPEKKNETFVDE